MTLQVREYATLTTDSNTKTNIDVGLVSQATFDWLLDLHQKWSSNAKLLSVEGRHHLKLANYVGYLQSPTGEGIEILPKTENTTPKECDNLRLLLQRMLRASPQLKSRETTQASLKAINQPVHEWIIGEFLRELAELVRRGLRFDYQTIEDDCRFIRGQLDINKQVRQTPDKATSFHVRYAEFNPQRLENRLLRSALDAVLDLSKDTNNWRLANTLRQQLIEIEAHPNPLRDLPRWDNGKQLIGYRAVKPWCQLILESLNPHFQRGKRQGIALLFPMERLYENYVGDCLRSQLREGFKLTEQASNQSLLIHQPEGASQSSGWFKLKPDFLIQSKNTRTVLDAKWKRLEQSQNTTENKYKLSQSDLYQMFAYGQKYIGGTGDMALIYPQHQGFTSALPVFDYGDGLRVWVVPFDLHTGTLVINDIAALQSCLNYSSVEENSLVMEY